MMCLRAFILLTLVFFVFSCGKVGPLTLPEDKLDKSVITYPCNEECQKRFEEEKKRQQKVTLQSD